MKTRDRHGTKRKIMMLELPAAHTRFPSSLKGAQREGKDKGWVPTNGKTSTKGKIPLFTPTQRSLPGKATYKQPLPWSIKGEDQPKRRGREHSEPKYIRYIDLYSLHHIDTWDPSLSRPLVTPTTSIQQFGVGSASHRRLEVGTFYPNHYKSHAHLTHHPDKKHAYTSLLVGASSKH
jgi:hypothetical protein